jgi:hypothetical protein
MFWGESKSNGLGATHYVAVRRRGTHEFVSRHSGKTVSQAVAAAKQSIKAISKSTISLADTPHPGVL